jgi:hypothetical protein
MLIVRLAALTACMLALSAHASLVRGAIETTGPAAYNPEAVPANLSNQSGLSAAYTSGVTDFDSYVANTTHDSSFSTNVWVQHEGGSLIFDLGGAFDISGLALWNRGQAVNQQGIRDFALYSCADAACTTGQLIGTFVALNDLGMDTSVAAQTFVFSEVNTTFMKLDVLSNYNTEYNIATLGEVVFREAAEGAAVPEPASAALVLFALGALAGVRRRTT